MSIVQTREFLKRYPLQAQLGLKYSNKAFTEKDQEKQTQLYSSHTY